MCALCGAPRRTGHWSDLDAVGGSSPRHRQLRLSALRRLLDPYGVSVTEWQGRYLVGNGRGRSLVADDLGAVFAAVARLRGSPVPVVVPSYGRGAL